MIRPIAARARAWSSPALTGVALIALTGCSLLTDAPLTTARVEVDPVVTRTIQFRTSDGWSEPKVTTKRLDEIECTLATPCRVAESIRVTIHNTGEDRLD